MTQPTTTAPNGDPTPDLVTHDAPVDVAAIMREVRRRVAARQSPQVDTELGATLHTLNAQWDKIYEPLHLPPAPPLVGRVWNVLRGRFHWEVRTYLDPMIYRQTEFNAAVVRAFNSLSRRTQGSTNEVEIEALRDEVMQLRERIRHLEERRGA